MKSIYVVKKGAERVTVADKESSINLVMALMVLDCTEPINKAVINGNKQALDVYEVSFLDKHINVIGLDDSERVIHWMLSYGCKKVAIEKLTSGEETDEQEE